MFFFVVLVNLFVGILLQNLELVLGLFQRPFKRDKLSSLKAPFWLSPTEGNIIVTGANTGLGKESALHLARIGYRVLLTARDEKKGKEALEAIRQETGNEKLELHIVDFASFDSIKAFAAKLKERNLPIHVLINNVGAVNNERIITKDGLELTMQANHLSPFLLTNLLLDNLKLAKPAARVITVSSIAHWAGVGNYKNIKGTKTPYLGPLAYAESKLSNVLFTRALQDKLVKEGREDILALTLNPGAVKTEFLRSNSLLKTLMIPMFKSPSWGARTQIYLALAPAKDLNPGGFYQDTFSVPFALQAYDTKLTERYWKESAKIVGIEN